MNILYISSGRAPDYLCDSILLGLRLNWGVSVVDYPRIPFLYQGYPDQDKLYGNGFTLYGLLPDHDIDRDGIEDKIKSHFYDLIIYGSIHRSQAFLDQVIESYFRHEVLFLDGEDQPISVYGLTRYGLYFKRELYEPRDGLYPIHFGIPSMKIGTLGPLNKSQIRATCDPRDRSTYIFKTEHDYYADYHRSMFAFTLRKGGWDCLRHLEIMANGCIPLFLDLDQCPPSTCTHLPKPELLEALTLMDKPSSFWDSHEGHMTWLSLWRRIHLKFSRHCTAEAVGRYLIETQERVAAMEPAR